MTEPAPLAPPSARLPAPWLRLVVVAALLVRSTALPAGFLNYDDQEVRVEAASKSFVQYWTEPFYYAYKPVYATSLGLDSLLFGDAPLGWHVANWLLFAACAACVALLVHGLLRSRFLAVAAGLLFAVHPVHAENVSWVAERKDVLSLLLVLLAHLAWRASRARDPARVPVLGCVLFVLGGLAKGTVWTYALVIAVDEALARVPGRARRLLPLAALAGLGIGLDVWVGAAYGPGAVHHDASTLELAAAMAGVHARYLASLLWPFGLSIDYGVDPRGSFADPFAIAGLLLAVAAVAGLVVGLRRRRPLLAFACALWVAGLVPVNNVWPTTSVLRADRYLIVPAIGLYLLVGAALARARAAGVAALAGAALGLGVLAALRGLVFRDPQSLWTDAIEKRPESALAWLSRAQDRQERREWVGIEDDGRRGTEAAIALRRPELEVRGRLLRSLALLALGRVGEALTEARRSVATAQELVRSPWARDPASVLAASHARVGMALQARGEAADDPRARGDDLRAATDAFRAAVAADPTSLEAQIGLGALLATSKKPEHWAEARAALTAADRMDPGRVEVAVPLVTVLYNLRTEEASAAAKAAFAAAWARNPESRTLRLLQAKLYAEGEDEPDKAAAEYERVLARDPHDAESRRLLVALRRDQGVQRLAEGRASRDAKATAEAAKRFDQALAVDPQDLESLLFAGDAALDADRVHDARERYAKARAARPSAVWIRNLEARAAVLESVTLARRGLDVAAATAASEALTLDAPRLDLGFAVLDREQVPLKAVVPALASSDPAEAAAAGAVLRAAAWLVAGDESAAIVEATRALGGRSTRPEGGSTAAAVERAALLVRALARARGADLAAARSDLELAARGDPEDPLLRHHAARLERTEAWARLRIAQGGGEAGELEAAKARAKAADAAVVALADASPPWPGPGLAAVEVELQAGDSLAALKRLTTLSERFPDSTAVRRGLAAVYQMRVLSGGDKQRLLMEARRALLEAKALDPRDPRTALDLSQLYRLEGNLEAAARNALVAAAAEPIPGPAARVYAAILVELGKRALEARDAAKALKYAARARAADRGGSGPDLLEGDVKMATGEWDAALAAYETAREEDPASAAVRDALVACHHKRGDAYFLWRLQHPKPAAKDGVEPDPKKVAAWDEHDAAARRQAAADLEAALRIDPDGPESSEVRESLSRLEKADPDGRRRAVQAADAAFEEGESLRRAGKALEALARYRAAVAEWAEDLRGWMRIAEAAVTLGSEYDVEGLRAVEKARDVDVERAYPVVDLYAATIWDRRRLSAETEAARADAAARAKTNLERFLARTAGVPAQEENRKRAKDMLARLGG